MKFRPKHDFFSVKKAKIYVQKGSLIEYHIGICFIFVYVVHPLVFLSVCLSVGFLKNFFLLIEDVDKSDNAETTTRHFLLVPFTGINLGFCCWDRFFESVWSWKQFELIFVAFDPEFICHFVSQITEYIQIEKTY